MLFFLPSICSCNTCINFCLWPWCDAELFCMHAPTEPFVNGWDFLKTFFQMHLCFVQKFVQVLNAYFDIHDHAVFTRMNNMIVAIKTWNTPVTSRWNGSSLLHWSFHASPLARCRAVGSYSRHRKLEFGAKRTCCVFEIYCNWTVWSPLCHYSAPAISHHLGLK